MKCRICCSADDRPHNVQLAYTFSCNLHHLKISKKPNDLVILGFSLLAISGKTMWYSVALAEFPRHFPLEWDGRVDRRAHGGQAQSFPCLSTSLSFVAPQQHYFLDQSLLRIWPAFYFLLRCIAFSRPHVASKVIKEIVQILVWVEQPSCPHLSSDLSCIRRGFPASCGCPNVDGVGHVVMEGPSTSAMRGQNHGPHWYRILFASETDICHSKGKFMGLQSMIVVTSNSSW